MLSPRPPLARYDLVVGEVTILERNLIDGQLHSLPPCGPLQQAESIAPHYTSLPRR